MLPGRGHSDRTSDQGHSDDGVHSGKAHPARAREQIL